MAAAATLDKPTYKWKWDYSVRQIFDLAKPVDSVTNKIEPFTEAELKGYRGLVKSIKADLENDKQRTQSTLNSRVKALKGIFKVINDLDQPPPRPPKSEIQKVTLNSVFDEVNLPKDSDKGEPAKPKGRPQLPMPAPPAGVVPNEANDNITLDANPPTIYEAIKDANIRAINLETKSSAFNPEQTFSATITPIAGGAPIPVSLTPIQYAALRGLKGVVRLLLKQNVDALKRINEKPILQAVKEYRKNDEDKADVVYIFMIVNQAIQDATDDYSSGVPLDKKYGEGLAKDVDKALAKLLYEREYKELETPTQPLPTAVKTTSVKVEDAKKKGREDAEKKEPRDSAYAVGSTSKSAQEIAAYNAEYTKSRVGKDAILGKEDGEKGYPINPEYVAASTTKTAEEKKAYGEEYDKSRAKYQGEKDALLNEESKFTLLESQLSTAYTSEPANSEHKKTVKKLYDAAYEANRGKTTDLVKEAGYVGAYPPSETVLSGNFFGFGPELTKLIGLDVPGQQPVADTYAKYKEGLIEFVKNIQSILGQAKYAGYMDGLKKLPKYTTPGRVSVKGKEYAIDFGKLNTRLETLPEVANGALKETAEFTSAQTILNELKRMRDSASEEDSLEAMVTYLRSQSNENPNGKIKQILKPIVVSQKGGASLLDKERLRKSILDIKNDGMKTGFLKLVDNQDYTNIDDQFNLLKTQVDTQLVTEKKEEIRLLIEQLPEEQRDRYVRLLETTNDLNNLNIFESTIKADPIFTTSQQDSASPKQTISAKNIEGITLRINRLKNRTTKQMLQDRVVPTLTSQEYRTLDKDVADAYGREVGLLATIKTLVDPEIKQRLLTEYETVTDEGTLEALEKKVKSELQRNPLAITIQSLKDKKDFETRFRNPDQDIGILTTLVDDQYKLENPGFGERLQSGISKAKFAIQDAPSAVSKSILTGLGSVSTKTQLYDLVNKTLSAIPKYVENPIGAIPKGVAPDDPSLGSTIHPLKRVQAVYDREFERGTKEGVKKGGTRRKSKKSSRFTKKQSSKK